METEKNENKTSCFKTPKCRVRFVLSFLAFWSLLNLYALRINLSLAMVAMAKAPERRQNVCTELQPNDSASGQDSRGEFSWGSQQQGLVLSSFFYGYFLAPLAAGAAGRRWGARRVLGCGGLVAGSATLLAPVAARWSPWALCAVRVVVGAGSGVGFPSLHTLIGQWYPRRERTLQSTLIYNGLPSGCILALVLSAILIKSQFLGGWPAVFYLTGALTCTWFVFWTALAYENPQDHPCIGEEELQTIMGGEDKPKRRGPIPWRAIASSCPFYALCWTHFSNNWGFYLQLTYVPTFLHQKLHMDIIENGFVSALPYMMFVLFASPSAYAVDRLRTSGTMSITPLRKIANSVACFGPAFCLLVVPFLGCHPVPIIILLALSMGFNGLMLSGFKVTHIDMSPEFGGVLMSCTNTVANLGGMISPIFVGRIQEAYDTTTSWKIIFVTTSIVYISAGLVYLLFASADLQPWGISKEPDDPNNPGKDPVLSDDHVAPDNSDSSEDPDNNEDNNDTDNPEDGATEPRDKNEMDKPGTDSSKTNHV